MNKLVIAYKRRPELSPEAFREHWTSVSREKALQLPGIRRYVQNVVGDSAYKKGREPAFDAVAEVWLERVEGLAETPEHDAMAADQATVIDPESILRLPVQEIPIVDGPHAPLKLVMLVKRRPDLTAEQFRAHWRDVHAPIAARSPYMRRYLQWHVPDLPPGAGPAPFDGDGMAWFDGVEEMRAFGASPEGAEGAEDGPRFADGGGPAVTLMVSETVVLP